MARQLDTPLLRSDGPAVVIAVRVAPRAGRSAIAGERAGRLLIQTTAPPVDGRANDAVCRLLAKALGVATGRVRVVGGAHTRDKLVRVDGITAADAAHHLGLTSHDDAA
jgi:uncharacterized protein (TIGR00251 family)